MKGDLRGLWRNWFTDPVGWALDMFEDSNQPVWFFMTVLNGLLIAFLVVCKSLADGEGPVSWVLVVYVLAMCVVWPLMPFIALRRIVQRHGDAIREDIKSKRLDGILSDRQEPTDDSP